MFINILCCWIIVCVFVYLLKNFVYLLCPGVVYIVYVSACRYRHFPTTGAFFKVDTGISIGPSTWNTSVQRIQRDQFRTETQYQAGNEQRPLTTPLGFYLSLHQQPSALCLRIVMQIKSLAGELIRRPLISERFVSQTEESLAEGTQRGPPGWHKNPSHCAPWRSVEWYLGRGIRGRESDRGFYGRNRLGLLRDPDGFLSLSPLPFLLLSAIQTVSISRHFFTPNAVCGPFQGLVITSILPVLLYKQMSSC